MIDFLPWFSLEVATGGVSGYVLASETGAKKVPRETKGVPQLLKAALRTE
jgi:hypothetical protein